MFWSVIGVVIGSAALLMWLRGLSPDTSAQPLTSTARPAGRGDKPLPSGAVSQRATLGARAPGLKSSTQPFAALSVKTDANGCAAAAELSNVRYLQDTAPHLPLPECDRLACNCTFQRHADRRLNEHGERRGAAPVEVADSSPLAMDRRQLHGRRITDRS